MPDDNFALPTQSSSSSPITEPLGALRREAASPDGDLNSCRQFVGQVDEQLRLALDLGGLTTWDWNLRDNHLTLTGSLEHGFSDMPGCFPIPYEDFLARLHPDDRDRVHQELERSLTSGQPYRQEYRVVWPDGSIHWIKSHARVHCDEHGHALRLVGLLRDNTQRKRLEPQEARWQALFEAAQDAVLIVDDQRRYVEANPAACELFGLAAEQLLGRRIEEFVDDVRGMEVGTAWQQFQASGVQRGECRLRRADGSVRHLEFNAKADFAPGLHLSILRDVTERKRTEEALVQQAEQLVRSNANLQQFSYVTSHDLQAPLRTISSYSQMLQTRYGGQLDQNAHEFLGYIVASAQRMQSLISSLLAYARVTHVEAMPFEPVALETALQWARLNLQIILDETRAEITAEPLPVVPGDQIQLVQLLQNLIGNAVKYRRPGEPPQIHVSAAESEQEWTISVRDNGIGIQPEDATRIFGVCKRLHGDEIPGSGIGLAICQRIVEKHGGRIWVDSGLELGSVFRFTLPRSQF